MTLQLNDEQREALRQASEGPIYVVDPVSRARFVLLPDAAYERARALFEEVPFDVTEAYPLMDEVARGQGWEDPAMDAYDRLDPRRTP
jgi:hypothetical protein